MLRSPMIWDSACRSLSVARRLGKRIGQSIIQVFAHVLEQIATGFSMADLHGAINDDAYDLAMVCEPGRTRFVGVFVIPKRVAQRCHRVSQDPGSLSVGKPG